MKVNSILAFDWSTIWDHGVVNGKGTSTLKVMVCTEVATTATEKIVEILKEIEF